MFKIKVLLSILFNLCVIFLISQSLYSGNTLNLQSIRIEYSKALGDQITIEGTNMIVDKAVGQTEPETLTSGNVTAIYKSFSYTLTEKDVFNLVKIFQQNKWNQLKEAYGVPDGNRYYPEKIIYYDGTKSKTVLYRSGQGKEVPLPKGFKKIREEILKLKVRIEKEQKGKPFDSLIQ